MKRYHFILLSAIFFLPFSGCRKDSFDPTTKSREDFIGTWAGSISTFKNNQLLKEYATVVVYPDAGNNSLSGILFMKETNVFHEFQFVNGTVYFNVVNNDPENPFCQAWSLGGYMVFTDEGEIEIRVTGNECGQLGNEFVNWVGTIVPVVVTPESSKDFIFANNGNSWTYRVTLNTGDSCQVQKQISQVPSSYLFGGMISQTCGWPGQDKSFKWTVTPAEFTITDDSTLTSHAVTFPINAKPGVVYSTYFNYDTVTVTLLDTNVVTTTPAGTYTCFRYRYTEPVYTGNVKSVRTAYLWLDNRYGVIRHEVADPWEPSEIRVQVLISKNF